MSLAEVVGLVDTHLRPIDGHQLHRDIINDWQALKAAALKDDLELGIVSSFRSFQHQAAIWNAKVTGKRPILLDDNQVLDINNCSQARTINAILRFSALPGASRHHWGTDLDIYAINTQPINQPIQLTPDEYSPDGPQGRLARWLSTYAADFGFFRPYARDRGGIAIENWHISHLQVSHVFQQALKIDVLRQQLEQSEIEAKDFVLEHLPEIFTRYVCNIDNPAELTD